MSVNKETIAFTLRVPNSQETYTNEREVKRHLKKKKKRLGFTFCVSRPCQFALRQKREKRMILQFIQAAFYCSQNMLTLTNLK